MYDHGMTWNVPYILLACPCPRQDLRLRAARTATEQRDLRDIAARLGEENKRLAAELQCSAAENAKLHLGSKQMSAALERARSVLVETGESHQRLRTQYSDLKKEVRALLLIF